MALYENKSDFDANYVQWDQGRDYSFPLHVHRCPEILVVTSGAMVVATEDAKYLLREGDTAIIWAHQAHSYRTEEHSTHERCVFAPELVQRFFSLHASHIPEEAMIPSKNSVAIRHFVSALRDEKNIFAVKGLLYMICAELEKCVPFRERGRGRRGSGESLLLQILTYVNEHYQGDCTLDTVAEALRYDRTYISKFFSRRVGTTLAEHVLQLRLALACELLCNTEETIISIGEVSGFNSSRTFNRNFKERYGVTPSEYRAGERREVAHEMVR